MPRLPVKPDKPLPLEDEDFLDPDEATELYPDEGNPWDDRPSVLDFPL